MRATLLSQTTASGHHSGSGRTYPQCVGSSSISGQITTRSGGARKPPLELVNVAHQELRPFRQVILRHWLKPWMCGDEFWVRQADKNSRLKIRGLGEDEHHIGGLAG